MVTRKLEEHFNLPPMDEIEAELDEIEAEAEVIYDHTKIQTVMGQIDKIDAALPQVQGLDAIDRDYDEYAKKAVDAFDDLVDLGKNVEDRLAAEIFNAASSMLGNALTAKTNKAKKKLEMVKLQIQNDKLKHEREKLAYLKARHLGKDDDNDTVETEGKIIATRNDIIRSLLDDVKNQDKS